MTAAQALEQALKDSGWKAVAYATDAEQQTYDKNYDRLVVVVRDDETLTVYFKLDGGEL